MLGFRQFFDIKVKGGKIFDKSKNLKKNRIHINPAFSGINICTRLQEFYNTLIYKRITYLLLLTFSRTVHIIIYAQFEIKTES